MALHLKQFLSKITVIFCTDISIFTFASPVTDFDVWHQNYSTSYLCPAQYHHRLLCHKAAEHTIKYNKSITTELKFLCQQMCVNGRHVTDRQTSQNIHYLPRDATQSEVLLRQVVCLSVCLSVRPSVTLCLAWGVRSLQTQQHETP